MFNFDLMSMVAGVPGLIIALVAQGYAQARTAVFLGDYTPKATGRLTINPMAHLDPIGLILLLVAHFGWAKPVMINPFNFRDKKNGELYVLLAGPLANLVVGFLAMFVLFLYAKFFPVSEGFRMVFTLIVLYNINFAIFMMLPLPPLPGGRILMLLLPREMAYSLARIEPYTFIILIALMLTPILGAILIPIQRFILAFYSTILSFIL